MTEKKNKHMTLEDRIEIQTCLRSGMTFKAIARRIGKGSDYRFPRGKGAKRAPSQRLQHPGGSLPVAAEGALRLQWLRQTQPCQLPLCPAAIHSKGGALTIGMIVKLILFF